jgi:hypothetical protein
MIKVYMIKARPFKWRGSNGLGLIKEYVIQGPFEWLGGENDETI